MATASPPACGSYYSRPTQPLYPSETLPHFPPKDTCVAQQIVHPRGVGVEEGGGGGGDGGEDLRDDGSPCTFLTLLLTYIDRFALSQTGPPLLSPSHVANGAGDSQRSTSPILAHLREEAEQVPVHYPLNQINSHMLGKDVDVFITLVMPALHVQCSVIEAEEEVGKDELSKKTRKPLPCPNRQALLGARERNGFWAVVVAGLIVLREKVSKLLDDTPFIPRALDIYFENLRHTQGPTTEKNKAPARNLYDLIISTNTLLPIVELFFCRRRAIEQLWSHLNLKGGILLVIEWGKPQGSDTIAVPALLSLRTISRTLAKLLDLPYYKYLRLRQQIPYRKGARRYNLPVHEPPTMPRVRLRPHGRHPWRPTQGPLLLLTVL
ncbi:hypothetical protein HOY82DRAFT_646199 [Tuber indicum]|nr:hypothetical protein HOY82DRAFT_646199 [Tuber indicum]